MYFMHKSILLILICIVNVTLAQSVSTQVQNFGKVKEWNNPVFETVYINTTAATQLFLPIAYKPDLRVSFEKNKLQPGESTKISIQYFTEEFGKFNKEVDVFVSNLSVPITFKLTGNIQSFHPDALTICPRIDNAGLQTGRTFNQKIKVVDANTNDPLSDYEITITTNRSQERFFSNKSELIIKRDKSDLYRFEVDKDGYKTAFTDIYVFKNQQEITIGLEKIIDDEEYFEISEEETINDSLFASIIERVKEEARRKPKPAEEVKKEDEKEDSAIDLPNETVAEEESWKDRIRNSEPTPDKPATPSTPSISEEDKISDSKESDTEETDEIIVKEDPPKVDLEKEPDFTSDGSLNDTKYAYNHIVFLVDVSGSMKHETKLPLLKYSINEMIDVLRPEDKVSIITYSTEAITLVSNVSGNNEQLLKSTVNKMQARGQSFGKEGLDMAYELALNELIEDGNNEIILASDGVFNSRNFKEGKLYRQVNKQFVTNSIRLSTIGFGKSKTALGFLENLASEGEGSFIQIKRQKQAETILVENMMQHSRRDFINK